jgi:hypothetical protein
MSEERSERTFQPAKYHAALSAAVCLWSIAGGIGFGGWDELSGAARIGAAVFIMQLYLISLGIASIEYSVKPGADTPGLFSAAVVVFLITSTIGASAPFFTNYFQRLFCSMTGFLLGSILEINTGAFAGFQQALSDWSGAAEVERKIEAYNKVRCCSFGPCV